MGDQVELRYQITAHQFNLLCPSFDDDMQLFARLVRDRDVAVHCKLEGTRLRAGCSEYDGIAANLNNGGAVARGLDVYTYLNDGSLGRMLASNLVGRSSR